MYSLPRSAQRVARASALQRQQLAKSDTSSPSGPYELPDSVKVTLTKQLQQMYPSKTPKAGKIKVKGRNVQEMPDSAQEDLQPVKSLDIKHAEQDGMGGNIDGLERLIRHEDVMLALGRKKRNVEAAASLQKKTWDAGKGNDERGIRRMKVWEAKQIVTDGETLLDAEKKRMVPLDTMHSEDRLKLHGRAPAELEGHNQLDVDSLAFVLSTSLDKPKKPWERGNDPYDKTRLKVLLDRKINLDKLQARLSEIEAQDDTKLGPEYNYLRLKGRHMFHTYLDDLASLRRDLIEGLVDESAAEWNAFEQHETSRIEAVIACNAKAQEERSASLLRRSAEAEPSEAAPEAPESEAHATEASAEPVGSSEASAPLKKKKKKKLSMKAKEQRFRKRMEQKEVDQYMQQMRSEEQEDEVREVVRDVDEQATQPQLIWGTLPPTRDALEYQSHVIGSRSFNGWSWQRPVYYIPRIPWREAEAKRAKDNGQPYPFVVDDIELPMDWEENYRHFPYYKRQELWENSKLTSTVPSTDSDWPEKDKDFLQVYLSKHDFVHPGDWDVKLGRRRPSRYKTLQKNIFQDKFFMSPYENRDFEQFMMDPTKSPPHRLGLDMLGF